MATHDTHALLFKLLRERLATAETEKETNEILDAAEAIVDGIIASSEPKPPLRWEAARWWR